MDNYLAHHGVLGQKWGVRRYQNADGTRTSAGKQRYDSEGVKPQYAKNSGGSTSGGSSKKATAKKVAAATAAVAVTAAAGYYLSTHPDARAKIGKLATDGFTFGKEAAKKAAPHVRKGLKTIGKKSVKGLEKATTDVGKAMYDAAIASAAGIGVLKISEKLAVGEDASEADKAKSKIMTDSATAGLNKLASMHNGSSGGNKSNGNNNKGGKISDEITKQIGEPNRKTIDKTGPEWQKLFKYPNSAARRSDAERQQIKDLANAGYGIDQIQQYLNSIDNNTQTVHSAFYAVSRSDSYLSHTEIPVGYSISRIA